MKNWAGNLHFEKSLNQVLRTFPDRNRQKRVQNPVLQARDQAYGLKCWLREHNLDNIPIDYLFANSHNESIITADLGNEHLLQKVSTGESLVDKIQQISRNQSQAAVKKSYLKNMENTLIEAHTPQQLNLQQIYKVPPAETITGVHCPKCFAIPMTYENGKWHCHPCNYTSRTAFLPTLNDYFYLIKPTITNQEFREFFHLSSPRMANYFLHSLNLPFEGSNKGRIYHKPEKNFPLNE